MKKILIVLGIISFTFFSCGSSKNISQNNAAIQRSNNNPSEVKISGGNGSSFEDAVIVEASNSRMGIRSEYAYLDKNFGKRGEDWSFIQQALTHHKGIPYDVLTIKNLKNNEEINVYFNIKSFFGKF